MRSVISWVSMAVAVTFVLTSVHAAGPAPGLESYVPAQYDLTIRVNVRKALSDPVLEPLRAMVMKPGTNQFVDGITSLTGVNLRTDVDTIVLAGYADKSRKKDGLLLCEGRFAKDSLVAFFKGLGQYEAIPQGNVTIHGYWSAQDNEVRYAAFLTDNVIVMGRREAVKSAVGVRDTVESRLAGNPAYASRLAAVPADALIALVALSPAGKAGAAKAEPLMRSIAAVRMSVAVDQQVHVAANFSMAGADVAKLAEQVVRGALALPQLVDPNAPVSKVAGRAHVATRGNDVGASVDVTVGEICAILAAHPKPALGR